MSEINFLNIDLDIESDSDITPIVEFWGGRISVHRLECLDGTWYGSFETWEEEENTIIAIYHDLVRNLSPDLRRVWDQARKRDFDFGYEGGDTPRSFHSRLTLESISKLTEINGSVTITIYPPST